MKDPWLPLSSLFGSHLAAGLLDPNEKVCMLISDELQCWNRELIYGLFSTWESDVICSVPLPPRKKPDRLFWNATWNGLFTVKSSYYLQLRCRAAERDGEPSTVGKDRKFWKYLWALSLPPKVKSFLWRACIGILPTYAPVATPSA